VTFDKAKPDMLPPDLMGSVRTRRDVEME